MARFNFVSTGSAATKAIRQALIEREVKQRQMMLDGLTIRNNLAEQARLDAAAQRQAERDRIADERLRTGAPRRALDAGGRASRAVSEQ